MNKDQFQELVLGFELTDCRAVKIVMDENSEVGKQVREKHAIQREFLLKQGLEKNSYIDGFVKICMTCCLLRPN
ncbi:hypothetical protein EZV62_026791 [Acer yangbiense]|uniref:Uncharacterized protein n=1 Tax=Acer yangbiense TaxID=1000413 RepID=A0A5C7GSP5_9ROSI|nr:hypothetical protein EZV62_026791 [Acer yangbiense]